MICLYSYLVVGELQIFYESTESSIIKGISEVYYGKDEAYVLANNYVANRRTGDEHWVSHVVIDFFEKKFSLYGIIRLFELLY